MIKPKTQITQIYLIDSKNIGDSVENYAAEIGYRVSSDILSRFRMHPKYWKVNIITDNSLESKQILHRLITYVPKIAIIDTIKTEKINNIYLSTGRTIETTVVLADSGKLNQIANNIIEQAQPKFNLEPQELFNSNNNMYMSVYSYRTHFKKASIPKYSNGEQKQRFIELQSMNTEKMLQKYDGINNPKLDKKVYREIIDRLEKW